MKKVLVIGYVWPEPNSSAAGRRMNQLLEFFSEEGFKLTFASTASDTPFMSSLSEWRVSRIEIELNNPSFDRFLEELDPDVVLFDRFMMEEQFGWRVSQICPKALKILDTEDLHFLRDLRKDAVKAESEKASSFPHTTLAKREIASIYRCDLALIISEYEMHVLQTNYQVPANLLLYLPFMEEKAMGRNLPSFHDRADFVSIGNFLHKPNWDAVLNLKQNIWPLIRKELPQVQLHIYGAYPGQKVQQLHKPDEGFLVHGRAASAQEVISKARILLAPLRYGAGLKGKFIDAMHSGTPFLTTSIGGEGMISGAFRSQIIHDDPETFAREATKLYSDSQRWKEIQKEGFKTLEEKFSKKRYTNLLRKKLKALMNNLESHRQLNFIGSMLQHHQLASTRYLSKFIEMKNQLDLEKKKRPD